MRFRRVSQEWQTRHSELPSQLLSHVNHLYLIATLSQIFFFPEHKHKHAHCFPKGLKVILQKKNLSPNSAILLCQRSTMIFPVALAVMDLSRA